MIQQEQSNRLSNNSLIQNFVPQFNVGRYYFDQAVAGAVDIFVSIAQLGPAAVSPDLKTQDALQACGVA